MSMLWCQSDFWFDLEFIELLCLIADQWRLLHNQHLWVKFRCDLGPGRFKWVMFGLNQFNDLICDQLLSLSDLLSTFEWANTGKWFIHGCVKDYLTLTDFPATWLIQYWFLFLLFMSHVGWIGLSISGLDNHDTSFLFLLPWALLWFIFYLLRFLDQAHLVDSLDIYAHLLAGSHIRNFNLNIRPLRLIWNDFLCFHVN